MHRTYLPIEDELIDLRAEAKAIRSRNRTAGILALVALVSVIVCGPDYLGWLSRVEGFILAAALVIVAAIEDGFCRLRLGAITDRINDLLRPPHA